MKHDVQAAGEHGRPPRGAAHHRHVRQGGGRHPVRPPHRDRAPASAGDRARAARQRQFLALHAGADGARAAGAGPVVPASVHRRAERRHAPAPAYRAHAGAGEFARHLRPCAGRGRLVRHRGRRDPRPARQFAHPPGDHGAPDRVEARHRAGEIPPHLSPAARARDVALDRPGAGRRARRFARPDRAHLDDGRAASGEADGGARGLPRPAFLRRGAVRDHAQDAGRARSRTRSILSGAPLRRAALLPVRLMDRRRPRRQPVRHHRRDRLDLARECAGRFAPLPRAGDRSRAASVDHRARHARAGRLPRDA